MCAWFPPVFRRSETTEEQGPRSIRSLFHKFRRILELNNAAMEKMAVLERALGGEYIFDNAFASRMVRELSKLVHKTAYSLNAMSSDRYVELYDRFEYLKGILEDILAGGLGPNAARLTMNFSEISWENLPLVGMPNVCLAELKRMSDIGVVDGFVLTVTGCRMILAQEMPPAASQPLPLSEHPPAPSRLAEAVDKAAQALQQRLGGAQRFHISACEAGILEPGSVLPVQESDSGHLVSDLFEVCRQGARSGLRDLAVSVREIPPDNHQACLRTYHPGPVAPGSMVVTLKKGPGVERYYLRRSHPFSLLASEILPKDEAAPLADGSRALKVARSGLLRGSGLLHPDQLGPVAEAGIVLERALGIPQELCWGLDKDNRARISDVSPLAVEQEQDPSEPLAEALEQAESLLRGGSSAQAGVAAGRVVRIRENDDPGAFPVGAVAVARAASPQLAPFMNRAGALVTELGSTIGHLATVVREYRIPAIFGAADALKALPQDEEVTVDASVPAVYRGIIEPLLRQSRAGSELFATDPEFTTLRRLLQFIMPLSLTDPDAPNFAPAYCRSYHDIIHFVHERAVEELLHAQSRGGSGVAAAHRLQSKIPLDIHLIDAGGGLCEDAGGGLREDAGSGLREDAAQNVSMEQVLSEPLRSFLAGLEYGWEYRRDSRLSLRDVFSGLHRTSEVLQSSPEYVGRNLAIVAAGYFNLSLHMGYHFNVIDAFMGDNLNQNYIYFRFAGGLADTARRGRRVELLRRVLARLQFNISIKADLITARLKIVDREAMAAALGQLGLLAAFTRQLDISMAEETSPDGYETAFDELVTAYTGEA